MVFYCRYRVVYGFPCKTLHGVGGMSYSLVEQNVGFIYVHVILGAEEAN